MTRRGQANLAALAVAVVLVTAATGVGLALAATVDDSEGSESARERRLAASAAAELVAADSPLTARRGVVDAARFGTVDAADLPSSVVASNATVVVTVGDETVFERGDGRTGATVRRLVLVGTGENVTRRTELSSPNVTVPAGTGVVTVTPGSNASVTTLRVDQRVVRHDPNGVEGPQALVVDPTTATTIRAETATPVDAETATNRTGTLTLRYRLLRGEPTTLEVRVDV